MTNLIRAHRFGTQGCNDPTQHSEHRLDKHDIDHKITHTSTDCRKPRTANNMPERVLGHSLAQSIRCVFDCALIQVATSATDYWRNKIRHNFNRLTTTAQTVANVQIEVEKSLKKIQSRDLLNISKYVSLDTTITTRTASRSDTNSQHAANTNMEPNKASKATKRSYNRTTGANNTRPEPH